jgi:hypothetical protein
MGCTDDVAQLVSRVMYRVRVLVVLSSPAVFGVAGAGLLELVGSVLSAPVLGFICTQVGTIKTRPDATKPRPCTSGRGKRWD